MRTRLTEIKKELRKRMHQPIPEQGRWLAQVVRGYFALSCRAYQRTVRRVAPCIRRIGVA
jgi:hypothetical protein